ncbi:MAG TPA: helix-turn-helix domain-containing protein [Gemmatimonadaceae bacterium]|nr:helix-turn-helix domain-containing protein [Gemmatimonadaceae bacterium]
MISRQQILEAAFRVFAEFGFRGATTRRIADAAGVNEVTLFRRFKSKTALINEAAQLYAQRRAVGALPDVPVDPMRELTDWCAAQLDHLERSRGIIRKCMAELEEHPEMADCMRHGPVFTQLQLRAYARALRARHGLATGGHRVADACTLLHGALFADAMGREMMAEIYPRPRARAPFHYARVFLHALGVPEQAVPPPGASRNGSSRRAAPAPARAGAKGRAAMARIAQPASMNAPGNGAGKAARQATRVAKVATNGQQPRARGDRS